MTVSTATSRSGPYAGAGTTGPFTVNFRFLDAAHLEVIRTDSTGEHVLVLSTDYSVSGVGNPTGSVTLLAALPVGQTLTIIRDVPVTQEADYVQNDDFPAQSHEDVLDKLTMIAQQQDETIARSLTLPASASSGVSTKLPLPVANNFIGWNETATALQNIDQATLATIVAVGTAKADLFSGTGAQTAFALTANPGAQANLDVSIGGVTQRPGSDYTWAGGTTLTFTTAPPAGANNVLARYQLGLPQGVADLAAAIGTLNGTQVSFIQAGTGAVQRTVQDKQRDIVSVKDFGAKGDGVTDDYFAIKAACDAIQSAGGGTLVLPKANYFIGQHKISGGASANGITNFDFTGIAGLRIEGNGSKLVMQGGWTRVADYTFGGFTYSYHDCVGFTFTDCTNLSVRDLEMDGGAQTVVKVATAEGASNGITLKGCIQVSLANLYTHHFCTDGLNFTNSGPATAFKANQHVTVVNCKSLNNARQGASLIQLRHANFIGCEFSYTGQAGGYGGHLPMAGIDVEPNFYPGQGGVSSIDGDEFSGDITFTGCAFKDNSGFELIATNMTSTPYPVQFFGCAFTNTNGLFPQILMAVKSSKFFGCAFNDVGVYPGYTLNDANRTELRSCRFVSRTPDQRVLFHVNANPTLIVDGCEFYMNSAVAHTGLRLYIQSANCEFTNNYVFISAAEYAGATTFDVHSLMQQIRKASGNRWDTDLVTASKTFSISFTSATVKDDYFAAPSAISPNTGPYTLGNWYSTGNNPPFYAFPATQVLSSDPNTLDDYEEGTWTPVDNSPAALTFTTVSGKYTKVGNLVTATCKLTYPVQATPNNAFLGGLPFSSANPTLQGGFASRNTGAVPIAVTAWTATSVQLTSGTGGGVTNTQLSGASLNLTIIYSI